ncbi:MAG: hypothetical protein ACK4UJ_02590 [Leptonema sp. (in: bacteria)]
MDFLTFLKEIHKIQIGGPSVYEQWEKPLLVMNFIKGNQDVLAKRDGTLRGYGKFRRKK